MKAVAVLVAGAAALPGADAGRNVKKPGTPYYPGRLN